MYRQFLSSVFFKENWGNCSRQHVPRGNYKFKLKLPPGLAAVARLLRAACRRVNAPVVFLCFYFAARLSRRSRAACRVPCKRSFKPCSVTRDRRHATGDSRHILSPVARHKINVCWVTCDTINSFHTLMASIELLKINLSLHLRPSLYQYGTAQNKKENGDGVSTL